MEYHTTNAIYGISGALLGALIGWFTSWRIIKSNEYHKACVRFRNSFVDIQHIIGNTSQIYPLACINSYIAEQEKAIILFEPYISKIRITKLKKAFENYKNPLNKKGDSRNIYNYTETNDSGYTKEEAISLFFNNIEKVLSYARFKRFYFADIFYLIKVLGKRLNLWNF